MSRIVNMFFTLLTFLSFSATVWAATEQPCTFSSQALGRENVKMCLDQLSAYKATIKVKEGRHFGTQEERILSCQFIERFCSAGSEQNVLAKRVDELTECFIDAEDSDLGGPQEIENQRLCLESLLKFTNYDQIKSCFARGLGLTLNELKELQSSVEGNIYYKANRKVDIEVLDSCLGFRR